MFLWEQPDGTAIICVLHIDALEDFCAAISGKSDLLFRRV